MNSFSAARKQHWTAIGVALVAAALAAPAAEASFPGANGRFAFTGNVTRQAVKVTGLNTMLPDGSQVRKIADLPFTRDPSWSPDGRRIAFVSEPNIYVVDANGRGLRQLTHGDTRYWSPSWSPDGRHLVASRLAEEYENHALVVIDTRTGRERVLAKIATLTVRWSPDGSRIAYVGPEGDIYTIHKNGKHVRRLTDEGANTTEHTFTGVAAFDWSPDGRSLVFEQRHYPDCEACITHIWRIRADGTRRTLLATGNAFLHPLWSPDGRTIAYCYGNQDEATDAHPIMRAMTPDGRQLGDMTGVTSCAEDWQARSRRWQRDWD